MDQTCFDPNSGYPVTIARCDRWQAYQRLQELDIGCHCLSDGSLRVEIDTVPAAFQVRSVLSVLAAPRQDLADYLEQCWQLVHRCNRDD